MIMEDKMVTLLVIDETEDVEFISIKEEDLTDEICRLDQENSIWLRVDPRDIYTDIVEVLEEQGLGI